MTADDHDDAPTFEPNRRKERGANQANSGKLKRKLGGLASAKHHGRKHKGPR